MQSPFTPELLQLIQNDHIHSHRPLIFGNAHILTMDSLIGDIDEGDLLLGGSRIVGVGPGLLSAADDDGAIVIDCTGFTIVPAIVDMAQQIGIRPADLRSANALAPGNPGTFAILPAHEGEAKVDPVQRFLQRPSTAVTIISDGAVTLWNGAALTDHQPVPGMAATAASPVPGHRIGTWIDENDFVHQHLSIDGRYDETRGGREHAYQGRFWINGDRIDYLDDLGFWAFGEFIDDTLIHAGYTFHRS
jgi:hypothetical protein